MFNFNNFKEKAKSIEDWLTKEMGFLRTGRAAPVVLDAISIDAYGGKMSLKELASVTVEDPQTIRVEPWDKAVAKDIEKAIQTSNLGLSVNADDRGLRVIFPALTSERREQIIKVAKQKMEEGRISVRTLRDEVMKEIAQADGGEDTEHRHKEELQKLVEATNKKLGEIFEKKEKEISI